MKNNAYYHDLLTSRIPWGSSTCSKRVTWPPEEPAVIVRGRGCRVWDADGREYIDFRNGLGPISLGYCYPEVDEAIREQLSRGIIFGYPHPLEAEVAHLFSEIIPGAERVRFLKTGGEAVAACIKIARQATGRSHVIQIGYNGWLNALAGRGLALPGQAAAAQVPGVPPELSALHHAAGWNNREQLEELRVRLEGRIAAVVVAADYDHFEDGATFYPFLRQFADQTGAALVFDEIVTGFRIAIGGVQEYFGVTPDLAVFAKGVANGMPLAVYCGKAAWMRHLEQAIVSSTYGGDALSLAAAKAVIGIYRREPVIKHLWQMGERMWGGLEAIFAARGIPAVVAGRRPVAFYHFLPTAAPGLPERLGRAFCRAGVTLYRGGYVNYSHQKQDIDEALERIRQADF